MEVTAARAVPGTELRISQPNRSHRGHGGYWRRKYNANGRSVMVVNGGPIRSSTALTLAKPLRSRRARQADVEISMRTARKKTTRPTKPTTTPWTKTVTVSIDLAACLRALAFLVFLLI
jgi:hypothetical protein